MSISAEKLDAIAEYFTGPAVVDNSIKLGMGGAHTKMAKLFFDARARLNIEGYASKEEALQRLSQK